MPFEQIDASRIRIKLIIDELQRWPSPNLVRKLCCEADCGGCLDPRFASLFGSIREAGIELLSPGGCGAVQRLPIAIALLDDAVAVRKMALCN